MIPIKDEIAGLVVCDKTFGNILFSVTSTGDQAELFDRTAYLLATYTTFHAKELSDVIVLTVPKNPIIASLEKRVNFLTDAVRKSSNLGMAGLSRREREVLTLVCQNLSNKEIASRLFVTERTIKFHVSSLLSKCGVQDRVALARKASAFKTQEINTSYPTSQEKVL